MIQKIKLAGKYLDQPLLVGKFKKAVPSVFITGAALYGANEVRKAPEGQKKRTAINVGSVLAATVASSLAAPKIAAKLVGKPYEKYAINEIKSKNTALVDEFVKSGQNISDSTKNILEKAKTKVLKYKEVQNLHTELSQTKKGKKFFNTLIPEPDNISAKDIRDDIARLSIMGAIPVAGGVAGGIVGEKVSDKKISKAKMADRVKEGAYQYLANIFLCNVGAGLALAGMEKMNVKSKSARAIGMITGIVSTGIIGGNAIANFIGKKVINPIFEDKETRKKHKGPERTPEVVDICLHSDDIATIAVMSGLKWIEPSLPILYGISGYRAGIGYRNGKKHHEIDVPKVNVSADNVTK
ncbi:MAG: hypothetical protein NC200_00280 [Candidatus Gastranaerophilales bacterium]|nr:hypothetical protein [Candidatus Gastranaerophilales bacterium]